MTTLFAAAAMSSTAALTDLGVTMSDLAASGKLGSGVRQETIYSEESTVYSFTGAGAITDISNQTLQNAVNAGSGYLTIAAWVNPTTTNGIQSIFSYGGGAKGFNFSQNGADLRFTTKGKVDTAGGGTVVANTWNLLAITINLTNGKGSRFMLGEKDGSYYTRDLSKWDTPATQKFAIGSFTCDGLSEQFTGSIANLTFFTSDSVVNNSALLAALGSAPVLGTDGMISWAGTQDANVWNTTNENWLNEDGASVAFADKSSVSFGKDAYSTVVVEDALSAASVLVSGDYTFSFSGEGASVSAAALILESGARLELSGNGVLIAKAFSGSEGTVALNGATFEAGADFAVKHVEVGAQGGKLVTGATLTASSLTLEDGVTLTKAGTGTLALSGNLALSQGQRLNVDAGTLQIGSASLIETSGAGTIALNDGTSLYLRGKGGVHKLTQNLETQGNVVLNSHDASQPSKDAYQYDISGDINVKSGTLTITNDANNWSKELALSGKLSGAGTIHYYRGTGDGNYNSNGRLIISGTENSGFTGTVFVEAKSDYSAGLDLLSNMENATIRLDGSGQEAYLRVLGNVAIKRLEGNANAQIGAANTFAETSAGDYTLSVGEGDYKGALSNYGVAREYGSTSKKFVSTGSLTLKKVSDGTLTLSGGVDLKGITVDAGTLSLTNAQGVATQVFVQNGGTVSVTGNLKPSASLTQNGGSLSVGGTLETGALTLAGTQASFKGAVTAKNVSVGAENTEFKGGLNVGSTLVVAQGKTTVGGTLTTGAISVSGGRLDVEKLSAVGDRLNLTLSGGTLALNNAASAEYSVDLRGGEIDGLDLSSAKSGSVVRLREGTLSSANLSAGTVVLYSEFVDSAERTGTYLNNDVAMTIDGSLTLSAAATQLDFSNLIFEKAGDSYALFNVGAGADGSAISSALNQASGLGGTFSYDSANNYVAFTAGEGMGFALIWDSEAGNDYWSATTFQGKEISNLKSRSVNFGKILPTGADTEIVNILAGAQARSLIVAAAEGNTYRLEAGEADASLTLESLRIARGALDVRTTMTVGKVEVDKGTFIAGAKGALTLADAGTIAISKGILSLQHSQATNAANLDLSGGSSLEFVSGALSAIKDKGIKIASTSEDSRAVLHWLDGATDDVAAKVEFENGSHVEFKIDSETVEWGADAYVGDSGNIYYKTGLGTISLASDESLGGTFRIEEGTLALGHAESKGRIFNGNIIASGETATLLLAQANSFGTSEGFASVSVELRDGAQMLLARNANDDRQTLVNVSLKLGENTRIDSQDAEEPNLSGIVLGAGTSVVASGDAEIATQVQLSVNGGTSEFTVEQGATLTLSGALVDSLEFQGTKLKKSGTGTLVLSGALTGTAANRYTKYSGATEIAEGTLRFEGNGTPGSGDVTVASGAVLEVDTAGSLEFAGAISGDGVLRVLSGTAAFQDVTGLSGFVGENAFAQIVNNKTFTGSMELLGKLGGNGTFSGDVTLGENAHLSAAADEIFNFNASSIAGTHAFTKSGLGDVVVGTTLASDFDVKIEGGILKTAQKQTIDTLTFSGGVLGADDAGAGSWVASKLNVVSGTGQIQSKLELNAPLGQNNLRLDGALYVGGLVSGNTYGSLEVAGTLNLSMGASGSLNIGSPDGNNVVSGGRLYADVLNADGTVRKITLGTTPNGNTLSQLAFKDATFKGDIEISGAAGEVVVAGTALFEGAEVSTIDGNLVGSGDKAVVNVAQQGSRLEVGGEFQGSLTKTGEGTLDIVAVSLDRVNSIKVNEGQFIIEDLLEFDFDENPDAKVELTQVQVTDGAILQVRADVLELAQGGSFELSGGSRYTGNLLIGAGTSLTLDASTISGQLTLVGDATVNASEVDSVVIGDVGLQLQGTLSVSGGAPAIRTDELMIHEGLKLDNIKINYGTLGSEFALIEFDESLSLIGDGFTAGGNSVTLDTQTIDGRDVYLTVERKDDGFGHDVGALKIVAYGTLIWDGAEKWEVGKERGWLQTSVGGNSSTTFSNDKYVAFNFSDGQQISVAENVNVSGVVFDGNGRFTLNFDGGVIKDKSDGAKIAASVQSGTVVFNNKGKVSAEGVFSGGLTIAKGAAVETNSDKLIGTGTISLYGALSFVGASAEYNVGEVAVAGTDATLNVVEASTLVTLEKLSGTVLTKTGAGSLTLSGAAELGKLVIEHGNVVVSNVGETGIASIVVEEEAGTLTFESGATLGGSTTLDLADGKRAEFVSTETKLNYVDLADGSAVAFRKDGTFTLGGTVRDDGADVPVEALWNKDGNALATIGGNLALQGVAKTADGKFATGATMNVVAGTLKIDGSVSDIADANAGNFLLAKSGNGVLNITGDLDSKASLSIDSGKIAVDGSINLSGDVEVGGNAILSIGEGGTLGSNAGAVVVAEGKTLQLDSSKALSVLSELTVAGTLAVNGDISFSGAQNVYSALEVAAKSKITVGSGVKTFNGETLKLGANAAIVVDGAQLSGSSGVLTVDATGTTLELKNDGKITFSAAYVTGEQVMNVTGKGEMTVLGEIETKLTLDISAESVVTVSNAKLAQVGKFTGEGTFQKSGRGDLYLLQDSSAFAGTFAAREGTTYFYGSGSLGQAKMIADGEVVFARSAVFGNGTEGVVANALVGGSGKVAIIGSGNSLKFANAIGGGFTGTLEARDEGTLVYNQMIAASGRNVSLKNAGTLFVETLNSAENETAGTLALGMLSVSGRGNELVLADNRSLELGSISIADAKGTAALTFSGSGSATVANSITKNADSKAELDIYTSEDFAGTLTLAGADNAHRNTYVNSGSVVVENATAGGTGTIFLANPEKSVVRIDVGDGNTISTALAGTGTLEGKSGIVDDLDAFSGALVAVDGGTFTLDKGDATELASKEISLGAESGATLVITTDKTVEDLDMGTASFAGNGTVRLDLDASQTLSVYTANTISGIFEIAGGTVDVLEDGNLGTAEIAINAGAKLKLNSDVLLNREISGAGTLVKNTSGTSFVAGMINTNASVATGALSIAETGDAASFEIKNGTLEFSQRYDEVAGKVVSRSEGTQTFKAEYVADGVARFSHNARNSSSVVDGSFSWKNGVAGAVIFAGGGTGSEFLPEIETGDIVKTGAGKWYVDAFTSSGSIKVENGGGTLAIGGYVGNQNQEIYIGRDGVLEIAEFGGNADAVVRGNVSGAGILAVSATTSEISFDLTGDSDWVLRVDPNATAKFGSGLSSDNILLASSGNTQDSGGTLNLDVAAGSLSDFSGKVLTIQGGSKDFLDIRNAKVVKTGTGTLDLSGATVNLNGLLQIKEGTVKAVSFKSNPTSGVIEVQGNGLLEIGAKESVGNLAALAGAGRVRFVAGTTLIENVNGAQSPEEFNRDFSGFVQIDAGATAVLKSYASFGNAGFVSILGTLESSQVAESTLENLDGNGILRVNNEKSFVRTNYKNNAFSGKIEVARGRLVVDTATFGALANEIAVSSDVESGLVLRNGSGKSVSLSDLTGKNINDSGTFFLESADADNAFVLLDGKSFGYGSRVLLASDANMLWGESATITRDFYVAENATLSLGKSASISTLGFRSSELTATRKVEGDLTIAGKLFADLPDAGTVAIRATGSATIEKTAVVEIDGTLAEGEEFALVASDVKAIENGASFRMASGERLSARVAENATLIVLGLATPVDELIPSGMGTLADTVFSNTDSDIYKSIYWSGTDGEQRAKLTNYSPVSFAGALELSTGLTQLENDLLRQRLEQRRYDRAYPEKEGAFKAFANVIGSSADSDEGENKSANYDMSHSGAVAGFDTLVNYDFVLGASFTYDVGKAKVHNGGGKHETDTARINVYGMAMLDDVSYFGFGAGVGVIGFDTKRTNALETLRGDASGTDLSLSTTLGRMFVLSAENGLHVSSYIGLDYTYSRIGGFSETGGAESALDVDASDRNSLRGTIGATLNWLPSEDWRFTLEAAFRHEFLDTDADINAKFIGGAYAGMNASATAYFSGEDVISVGPRVEYRINSEWAVSAGYTFESDFDNSTTHSANFGVRCTF